MTTPSSRELSFLASAITRNCGISEGVSFVFFAVVVGGGGVFLFFVVVCFNSPAA